MMISAFLLSSSRLVQCIVKMRRSRRRHAAIYRRNSAAAAPRSVSMNAFLVYLEEGRFKNCMTSF
jgi:hypothetical protein